MLAGPASRLRVMALSVARRPTLARSCGAPLLPARCAPPRATAARTFASAARMQDLGPSRGGALARGAAGAASPLLDGRRLLHASAARAQQAPQGQKWVNPENVPLGEHLAQFGTDLTEKARNRELDPVIGRDDEIRRTLQVLCRRTKNNPVLIGEPGVGKTAMADALAQRIANGEVPETIKNKRVVMLDLAAMVAGASMHGQFEERLKGVLRDVEASNGEIILFIDEVHMLLGAGAASGMSAANMLKPALARGGLHCVGATTLKEYRQYVEKDAALARRFQPVFVPEPSEEDTVTILRGLKAKYELHHGVRITDSALVTAAKMAQRYIPERNMPDKAIDLVDEAMARLRLQQDSKPEPIWRLERQLATRRIEIEALRRDTDDESVARRAEIEKEVEKLAAEHTALTEEWERERNALNAVKDANAAIEAAKEKLEKAQMEGRYEDAGELLHSVLPKLERDLNEAKQRERERRAEGDAKSMLGDAVTSRVVAEVVARSTGIPVETLMHGERTKLLHMEDKLQERVVGQPEAIAAVSDSVRLARAGLHPHKRPIGVFLFLGPTGVGKTELTKALAEFMFNDETAMTRIDCSEYAERHNTSRLIGAPPGYVGYDEGGQLSDSVRRRPYQLVLFDEYEKAHRVMDQLMLQVFDEGSLTDAQGFKIDFKNTVIVLTSNVGSDVLAGLPEGIPSNDPSVADSVMAKVREQFPPEFLNRLDATVIFNRLGREAMTGIVDVRLRELRELLAEKGCRLELGDGASQWLADEGFHPAYGARPLQRTIQRHLMNPMARMFLDGSLRDGELVRVEVEDAGGDVEVGHEASFGRGVEGRPSDPKRGRLVVVPSHAPHDGDDGMLHASESDGEVDVPRLGQLDDGTDGGDGVSQ